MSGTGRGAITADGCAVEVYLALPPLGEAEMVHAAGGPGTSVLDLGCGTGRIAHPLAELGHEVVAVDESAEMLAHVRGARTVRASIAELALPRRFDVVLLASHLLNEPDDGERAALLATAARHLEPGGRLVAQWHPPEWFDRAADGTGRLGEIVTELRDVRRDGDLLAAAVHYRIGDETWTQTFTARRLDDASLHAELAAAGLAFERWCTDDHTWFVAARR